MESQRIKTTADSGVLQGDDAGKPVKGRHRHGRGDTLGRLLSVSVTPAHTADQEGACRLLAGLNPWQSRLALLWADRASRGAVLARWGATEGEGRLELGTREPPAQGFVLRPWGWLVARTPAWRGRQRRLSQAYDRQVQTRATVVTLALLQLRVARVAKRAR